MLNISLSQTLNNLIIKKHFILLIIDLIYLLNYFQLTLYKGNKQCTQKQTIKIYKKNLVKIRNSRKKIHDK